MHPQRNYRHGFFTHKTIAFNSGLRDAKTTRWRRGPMSPLLLNIMMITEELITRLAEEKLSGSGFFLTGVEVKPGNNIQVFIDGDQSVTIADCATLSRYIESHLDRDNEDFNLKVSSAGVDQPLQFVRQYIKNVGRKISVELHDGKQITGVLLKAGEASIALQTETKKGRKIITGETIELNYKDINKAICLISFK